ncbi:MAG: PepSY-associated TM helix domain-containing protein [Deferribacterales bacterium]|jgi:hypothetical protein
MNWRKINYILHRDIGFLCIGLTLLYAISGVAVNHLSREFNPSYKIERSFAQVTPVPMNVQPDMNLVRQKMAELGDYGEFKNVSMMSPEVMRIFAGDNTIDISLPTGRVDIIKFEKRPILYELNYLHLNKPKGAWTIAADIYAVLLAYLAISGLLMIRKKTMRRGILLTTAGFAIPVIFLIFMIQ